MHQLIRLVVLSGVSKILVALNHQVKTKIKMLNNLYFLILFLYINTINHSKSGKTDIKSSIKT